MPQLLVLLALFILSLGSPCAFSADSANAQSPVISTDFGEITLPQDSEVAEAAAAVNDTGLSEADKAQKLSLYAGAPALIDKYLQLTEKEQSFAAQMKAAPTLLKSLQQELTQANQQFAQGVPDVAALDDAAIEKRLTECNQQLQLAQQDLSAANADNIALQTLPSRAQNTISANTARAAALKDELTGTTAATSPLDYRLKALEYTVCQRENALLQQQLSAQSSLQDIAAYQIRISTLKKDYYSAYIRALQGRQNQLLAADLVQHHDNSEQKPLSPALNAQLQINQQIAGYVDQQLQSNSRMEQELKEVENALTTVKQLQKSLTEQLNEVNGSLMLSRLLNRQQTEIPDVKVSFNLDELIPNLNLWLYDLRAYRDQLFDPESYAQTLMKKDPELSAHQEDLLELVRHRRTLYDQLNQSMSAALTLAINLKLQSTELSAITNNLNAAINDRLFWLASNLPLGSDLVMSYLPLLKQQLSAALTRLQTPGYWSGTLHTLALLLLPMAAAAALAYTGRRRLNRWDDRLALRLDKPRDAYYVTPLALIISFIRAVPQIALVSAVGTLIIYFALSAQEQLLPVTQMLMLHAAVFIFFLNILKPNALFQRHFSQPAKVIARQRALLDKLWLAVIPILIIANIRELDPTSINTDIIGYTLTLCCSLYLTCAACKSLQQEFSQHELSLGAWIRGLIFIAVPLTLTIMLALGYYYTVIKLVNRIAFSLYTCLIYLIISSTVRRSLFLAENRMRRRTQTALLAAKVKRHAAKQPITEQSSQLQQRRQQLDTLRLELINTKAYKLINVFLLAGTAFILYLQWSDLAGVLNYLNTIYLWKSESIVNGVLTISSSLTAANVITAAVILAAAAVLNRNLPALLERLFLLRPNPRFKSTSYTVKILSSYIIIALGIVLAAGALGISWDKLQWLVAALSVGLGFGLQEIFANFVSGIIILFERQIRVGDIVTINDLSGTVNKIRIRATTIISFDNKEVMIPNRQFITTALTNWSLSNTVTKIEFTIGVSYDADLDKAKSILHEIVRSCSFLAPDKPYKIFVTSLDASCVTITCEVFVNEIGNRKPAYDYLSTETLKRFAEAGIEVPFNQLDVTIKNLNNGSTLKVPAPQA